MDLKQKLGGQGRQHLMEPHHGQFNDVGAGALNGGIGGGAQLLGFQAATTGLVQINGHGVTPPVPPQPLGSKMKQPAAPQQGFHISLAEGQALLVLQKRKHPGVAAVVAVQKLLRLGPGHPGGTGKPLGTHAVDHPEVDGFAQAALLGAHFFFVQQDLGGEPMNIVPPVVGVQQQGLPTEMGQDPQFNLGIVRTDQLPTRFGKKRLTHLTTEGRADGDVLEVRVAAGETSGGGDRLIEVRMHPAGCGLHQGRQGIHVGAFQLAECAVLQDEVHHRMIPRQALQHHGIRAVAGFGLAGLASIQLECLKQNLPQLLG